MGHSNPADCARLMYNTARAAGFSDIDITNAFNLGLGAMFIMQHGLGNALFQEKQEDFFDGIPKPPSPMDNYTKEDLNVALHNILKKEGK